MRTLTFAALLSTTLLSAACNGDDTPSAAAPNSTTAAAGSSGPAHPGSATPNATDGSWCDASGLSLTLSQKPPTDAEKKSAQFHLDVALTNTTQHTCRLQGFPGVQLVGPNDPNHGPTYNLPRTSGDNPAPITLAPGGSAVSTLTYLDNGPTGWVPDHVLVTPPDSTTQLRADWKLPGQAVGAGVLRQDSATHPGTYIGPLQSGN